MDSSEESPLANLAKLQRIDRVRRERLERIEEVEREIAELESELARSREQAQAASADAEAQELRRRELENVFEAEGLKMKDRRMRLNRVRNEKELQALRHEIEVGKEANQQLEEQVIEALEMLDTLNEAKEQADSSLAEIETQTREKIANSQAQLEEMRAELEGDRAMREELRGRIDAPLLDRYELIFERRAGIAVVDVDNGICQGCHRMLPPQMYNEIQRQRDEVRLCPACHRILYWQPPEPGGD